MCSEKFIATRIGTIYHELGHVFGYCLANKNKRTYLGELLEVSIGLKKSAVILANSYYHYEKPQKNIEAIRFNTSNKERTVAWFIEVISGCTFQAIYEDKDFDLCFGGEEYKIGYVDYSNVANIARYSSFYYSIQEICTMQKKYHHFLLNNKILDFFESKVDEFVSMLLKSSECQLSLNSQEIGELVTYIDENINEEIVNQYFEIVESF